MNNIFSIFTLNSFLSTVIMLIFFPLLINFIDKYFGFFFQLLFERKKDYLWKETVLKNKNVKECIDSYKQLGSKNNSGLLYLYVGGVLGATVPIILTEACLFFAKTLLKIEVLTKIFNIDQLLSLIIPFLLFFISLLVIVVTSKIYTYSKLFKEDGLLINYNKMLNLNLIVASYTIIFLIFVLRYIFVIYNLRYQINVYLYPSVILFLVNVVFLIMAFSLLFLKFKDYNDKVKAHLNKKYEKNYPYVYVSTIGNNDATGQVKDIFNLKYLVLNNNGVEEIILWSSIDILKIRTEFVSENTLQKSIFDYND